MRLELQRLLARGPGGLPPRLVVDVGALLRRRNEVAPRYDLWSGMLGAARASHRNIAWVVAPVAYGPPVSASELTAAHHNLSAEGFTDVVLSNEPLGGLLSANGAAGARTSVVSAGVVERPYELWCVGDHVESMLDAETGVLWDSNLITSRFGAPPRVLPELSAIVGAEVATAGLGGKAAPRYREAIARALVEGCVESDRSIHAAIRTLVSSNRAKIATRAQELRGWGRADVSARAAFSRWLASSSTVAATAYVVASVIRKSGRFEIEEVHAAVGPSRQRAAGDAACTGLLQELVARVPHRWFVPRALDLLAAMAERGLLLPRAAVDPSHVALALEPASPPTIADLAPTLGLPRSAVLWIGDTARSSAPPAGVGRILDVLEELDATTGTIASNHRLHSLIETDLALTLPALARMERMGAWLASPDEHKDWASLFQATVGELERHELAAAPLLSRNIDIYTAPYWQLVWVLANAGEQVPDVYNSRDLTHKQRFKRLVHLGSAAACAVQDARSIVSPSGSYFWLKEFARAPTQLRGVSTPQATGRWALSDLPLQNVPKKSMLGKSIRSGLVAPPNHVLVGADQNGFEVRLLADLSGDLQLLQLAKQDDVHNAIAQHLFGKVTGETRKLAKLGMYAAIYGQEEDGFRRNRFDLMQADAVKLYRQIRKVFDAVFTYRDRVVAQYQAAGELRTRSGWIIRPKKKTQKGRERAAFNGTVQGLGADIQRWALRELDTNLAPFDARVVYQAHDEIFVAVPDGPNVTTVSNLLVDTMTTQVMQRSGLLAHPVRLVATPHVGRTWRNMI